MRRYLVPVVGLEHITAPRDAVPESFLESFTKRVSKSIDPVGGGKREAEPVWQPTRSGGGGKREAEPVWQPTRPGGGGK